ncbi:hypothetical protein HDU91_007521 [Kappamyces sp. JEL0680]|nr:hypothetical protein HDU91_007521 [Kappamyces sp. JEL0680]
MLCAAIPLVTMDSMRHFDSFFSKLVQLVVALEYPVGESCDAFAPLVVLNHYFYSFLELASLRDLTLSQQHRNALIRWARRFYDSRVADAPGSRSHDSVASILFDAEVCSLLKVVVDDVTNENIGLGINMSKFVVDLCYYWICQLAQSELSPEVAYLLFRCVQLWQSLRAALDVDEDSWLRLTDLEEEVDNLLFDLFLASGQPAMLSSAGMALLQSLMAGEIADQSVEHMLRKLVAGEEQLYAMLATPNDDIQKTAYSLTRVVTRKRVEQLSVSLEMQSEAKEITLNPHLVRALVGSTKPSLPTLACMLSWMSLLDHFVDSTFDLRQHYTNHVRELNIVNVLLEGVFELLHVDSGADSAFDLGQWDFGEFMIEGYESQSDTSALLLGAHIYYRVLKFLPALARMWYSECKNRQLSLAVESYTERFFTPLLLEKEIHRIQAMTDAELSVKINPTTKDITASYSFEEAELDIIVRLPSCYPLKLVEISSGSAGGRQAGISDARWRGWLLAVASVMMGHNGSIADALQLFKKNVALHFEGIEDCAICYSVISLADRSTPQKACRVCKHVFHGSCLYKWFKSSNQNTCPLCRNQI